MKKLYPFFIFTFFLLIVYPSCLYAQTPQYYNYNNGTSTNYFPFGVTAGKEVQWIIRPQGLNQPTSAKPGYIDTVYFRIGNPATTTFYNILIKFAQTYITAFPEGQIYGAVTDTVYFRSQVMLSSSSSGWLRIPLDNPWFYDTSRSLVVDVAQCGATNTNMIVRQTLQSPTIRNYINQTTGCNYVYSGQDNALINFGVHIIIVSGIQKNEKNTPSAYSLEQNYPNPFNPVTRISYNIPKSGNVKIVVSDMLGREVRTIVDEYQTAGNYTVGFDASLLASGVYYYTLRVNEFSAVKKMVVLK